jgi:nicotinate-nucleotide adenylyltransferase
MRTGVLGGTFDPIHKGHLAVAEEVRLRLNLDEVIFIPAGQPWLGKISPVTAAEHRIEMVRLAIADRPYFKLSDIEIDELPSNTVDTISDILAELPSDNELYLIISWDTLDGLPRWSEPWRLINMCHVVAVPRAGYPRPDIKSLETQIPGLSQSVTLLDAPHVDVSASQIRERVARGLSISGLVPETVERYIREHGLYLLNREG